MPHYIRAVLICFTLVLLYSPEAAFAANPPTKKRLSTIIRRGNVTLARLAATPPPGHLDIAIALQRLALNDLIDDVRSGSALVPKSVKSDFSSLLSIAKGDYKVAISVDRHGGEPDQISVALEKGVHLLQLALDLLKFKNGECEIDAEYHVYQSGLTQVPRNEIYVQCNRKWNTVEVTVLSAGYGDIGGIWRNYSRTEHPNPYPGGSTSCQNNLSSASCTGYLAAAGGYGALALGIYDDIGLGGQFQVIVKNRAGEIIDTESVTAD